MKIAFVNDFWERMGVQSISALLKARGHEVRLFVDPQLFDDENLSIPPLSRFFDFKKALIRDLKAYQPDLIGFSVVTGFYQRACSLARMIKKEMDVPIIFGGIHPTSVPERVIKNDFVDMVCVGEGEYPMLELADSMDRGALDFSIRNLWFKKNKQVISNDVRPLIQDLDSLPMPDKDLYYTASPHFSQCYCIMASRGCNHSCSYCCHSYLRKLYQDKGPYVRLRSVENVIAELKAAKEKYGIRYVRFYDDSLGMDRPWLSAFSEPYKNEVGLPFICFMHPQDISSEVIKLLKNAGCREIGMGVQSWTNRIRIDIINRKVSDELMKTAIREVKNAKIDLLVDHIIGLPHETQADIVKAAEIYSRVRPFRVEANQLIYFPGSEILERSYSEGILSRAEYEMSKDGILKKYFSEPILGADDVMFTRSSFLFLLVMVFPGSICRWILKRKFFGSLPATVIRPLNILLRIFAPKDLEHLLFRKSSFVKYQNFIFKFLFNPVP